MSGIYGLNEQEKERVLAESAEGVAEAKARDAALIASEGELAEGETLSEGQQDRIRKARLRMAQAAEGDNEDEDEEDAVELMFGRENFSPYAMKEIEELFYNSEAELQDNVTARLFAYYLQMEGQRK